MAADPSPSCPPLARLELHCSGVSSSLQTPGQGPVLESIDCNPAADNGEFTELMDDFFSRSEDGYDYDLMP